jgi:tetratricopeptide (TPR) repeat protein
LFLVFFDRNISLPASILFAINPIITETVIWIKNRIDIIAVLFYILSFITFIKWNKSKKLFWFLLSILFYIFSLLSKEIVITLPVIIILYLFYFEESKDKFPKKILDFTKITLPYWILSFVYLLFQKFVVEADKVAFMTASYFNSLWQHIYTVFLTFSYYLFLLLYPYNQIAERYLPKPESLIEFKFIASIILIAFYVGVSIYIKKYDKRISFFMLWIIIALLPVSNIIYLSTRPIAEHRLYIAVPAFCVIIIKIFNYLKQKLSFRYLYSIAIVLLFISYGYSTMKRVYEWRTPVSFWEATEKRSVPNYRTYLNLGISYLQIGKIDDSLKYLNMAKELIPEDPYVLNALGIIYIEAKKYVEAINAFQRALMKYPQFGNALVNLGYAYYLNGNIRDAIRVLEISKKISPDDTLPYLYLAEIYKKQGEFEKAEKEFRVVLEKENYPFDVHRSLIDIYEKKGMYDKAIEEYKKAISINPLNSWAYNGLGICYVHTKNYDLAEESFKRAFELDPTQIMFKKNLNEIDRLKTDYRIMKEKNKKV